MDENPSGRCGLAALHGIGRVAANSSSRSYRRGLLIFDGESRPLWPNPRRRRGPGGRKPSGRDRPGRPREAGNPSSRFFRLGEASVPAPAFSAARAPVIPPLEGRIVALSLCRAGTTRAKSVDGKNSLTGNCLRGHSSGVRIRLFPNLQAWAASRIEEMTASFPHWRGHNPSIQQPRRTSASA